MDEFDSELNGVEKGWLRYFLAPMQDGLFLSNGEQHVIGRAVFVFAGGISENRNEFYNPDDLNKMENKLNEIRREEEDEEKTLEELKKQR